MAVETVHLFVQTIQFQEAINPSEKMIGRDMRLEIELVEQPGMNRLPCKHRKPPDPHNPMESEAFAPIKRRVFQLNQPKADKKKGGEGRNQQRQAGSSIAAVCATLACSKALRLWPLDFTRMFQIWRYLVTMCAALGAM